MVQLKLAFTACSSYSNRRFQFQYGTIKTEWFQSHPIMDFRFQFQYGTIKTLESHRTSYYDAVFQFQYGTIKTHRHL